MRTFWSSDISPIAALDAELMYIIRAAEFLGKSEI